MTTNTSESPDPDHDRTTGPGMSTLSGPTSQRREVKGERVLDGGQVGDLLADEGPPWCRCRQVAPAEAARNYRPPFSAAMM